jgi:hypothetical protein
MKKQIIILGIIALIAGGCKVNLTKKKNIIDAKGIALCRCINVMNQRTDSISTINKDMSFSYFIEYSNLSVDKFLLIEDFVDHNIDAFIGVPKEIGHNMIIYTCWKLYESDELDLFVKKIVSKRYDID